MRLLIAFVGVLLLPSVGLAEEAPTVKFPDFDYEVICYASNAFVAQGNSVLGDISNCKKGEENARDMMRDVWPKLLPKGQQSCIDYAKTFARGSYTRLQECVSIGLLKSFKNGVIVRK